MRVKLILAAASLSQGQTVALLLVKILVITSGKCKMIKPEELIIKPKASMKEMKIISSTSCVGKILRTSELHKEVDKFL